MAPSEVNESLHETLAESVEKELSGLPLLGSFLHGIHNLIADLDAKLSPEGLKSDVEEFVNGALESIRRDFNNAIAPLIRRIQQLESRGSAAQSTPAPATSRSSAGLIDVPAPSETADTSSQAKPDDQTQSPGQA